MNEKRTPEQHWKRFSEGKCKFKYTLTQIYSDPNSFHPNDDGFKIYLEFEKSSDELRLLSWEKAKQKFDMFLEEKKKSKIKGIDKLKNEGEKNIQDQGQQIDNTIKIAGIGRPLSVFAKDISLVLKGTENIFYHPIRNTIIEISQSLQKDTKQNTWIIQEISKTRLLNILESEIKFIKTIKTDEGLSNREVSPTINQIDYLKENDNIKNSLYKVSRFSTCRLPFIRNDKLIIPKIGYNPELELFVLDDAPEITELSLQESIKIVENILKDFCFKSDIDKIMAIAGLITPACRGLYNRTTTRTPIFFYMANRERAGKDYLAGITGLIYEGVCIENPPICSEDKYQNSNEELRKKITASLMNGNKRLHFSNNRGKLRNTALESASTSELWEDRILGKNETIKLPNELELSLSANMGLSWTPDFWNRCRPINLFFSEEDPNSRNFSEPDLHGYVLKNRGKIISAIITLIRNWYDKAMPKGSTFTSFPEWARVVGGIMECAELGNPCTSLLDTSAIGGDSETINFKKLFEIMNNKTISGLQKEFTKSEIVSIIKELQENGEDIFVGWDFEEKKTQTSFGLKFEKYIGRTFSNIFLKLSKDNERSSRKCYSFERLPKVTTHVFDEKAKPSGNLGNLRAVTRSSFQEEYRVNRQNVTKVAKVTKSSYFGKCSKCGSSENVSLDISQKPICSDCSLNVVEEDV